MQLQHMHLPGVKAAQSSVALQPEAAALCQLDGGNGGNNCFQQGPHDNTHLALPAAAAAVACRPALPLLPAQSCGPGLVCLGLPPLQVAAPGVMLLGCTAPTRLARLSPAARLPPALAAAGAASLSDWLRSLMRLIDGRCATTMPTPHEGKKAPAVREEVCMHVRVHVRMMRLCPDCG
jgi:hypothetical protein